MYINKQTNDKISLLAKQNNIKCFRGDELDVMSRFIAFQIKRMLIF